MAAGDLALDDDLAADAEDDETSARGQDLDVPYVRTPEPVVEAMLELADIGEADRVVDLGCGDGRLVIAAARRYGVRALGVDIDPERVREARANARAAGVEHLVEFRVEDLHDTELSEFTVVLIYLLPSVNRVLRPRLLRELEPGSRVVSNTFDMGNWEADRRSRVPVLSQGVARTYTVYGWVVPAAVGGSWRWGDAARSSDTLLELRQRFQRLHGTVPADPSERTKGAGGSRVAVRDLELKGTRLRFTLEETTAAGPVRRSYQGRVRGDRVVGTVATDAGREPWTARRDPAQPAGVWTLSELRGAELPVEVGGARLTLARAGDAWRVVLAGSRADELRSLPPRGREELELATEDVYVWGASFHFAVPDPVGSPLPWVFDGFVAGDRVIGTVRTPGMVVGVWSASRGVRGRPLLEIVRREAG